jgi:RNA polymerase sigma-70 factor (ECF subfamily)
MADGVVTKPDAEFDRQWALTVLARSLSRLEAEMVVEGKKAHFDALKPWLTAESDATPQAVAAEKLGLSIEAVKVAIHRLRKRFRDAVKAEIAQTVSNVGDVGEELDSLMQALRRA